MNLNARCKWVLTALAMLLAFSGSVARAQSTAAAASAKVGLLNIRNAIVSTAEGKQAQAQLQSQFSPKQAELQNMQKQIEDIQRRMNEGARTLSDAEKARLQRQGESLARRLQRGNEDLSEELNAAQGDIIDEIGRKMLEVLDRYARENSYSMVLDSSAQGTPVVYGSPQVDITQEIVRLYDQAHPLPAATPAAAAPASRPATPPPAKKAP